VVEWGSPLGFVAGQVVAGQVIEGATRRRVGYVPIHGSMSGQEFTPGAARNTVCVLALQVAGPVMSMLLRLMNEVDRCLRNNHVEDVDRRAGRARQGRLTAEPLQRQEGCEVEGFIPERFGLSFEVAVEATYLLEPG